MGKSDNSQPLSVLRVPAESNHYQVLSIEALREYGIETTVAGYLDRETAVGFWTHDIVHIDWLDGFVRTSRSLRQRIKAQTLLAFLLLGAVACRRPVFWTMHNSQPHSGAGRAWRVWKRILAKLVTDTVTLSPVAAEHARSLRLKGSLIELGFGTFLDVFQPASRSEARDRWVPAGSSVLLVHFGQIREQKGLSDLLMAMTGLEGDDLHLVVAGNVTSQTTLDLLSSVMDSDGRVTLVNRFLEDGELASLLSAADIAVMPFDRALTTSSAPLAAEFGVAIVAPDTDLFRPYGSRYLYPPVQASSGLLESLRLAVADSRSGNLDHPKLIAPSWHDAVEPLAQAYRRAAQRPTLRRFNGPV